MIFWKKGVKDHKVLIFITEKVWKLKFKIVFHYIDEIGMIRIISKVIYPIF
jgi:hypothetical protein